MPNSTVVTGPTIGPTWSTCSLATRPSSRTDWPVCSWKTRTPSSTPPISSCPVTGSIVLTPRGVRQYGAVEARDDKVSLIESRRRRRYQVRSDGGRGDVVTTTLLGKIITLVANKLASLDPFGVGIEMEADRPGWCDALNGLPGLFGSSVNETIELKRLTDFTLVRPGWPGGRDFRCPRSWPISLSGLEELLHRPALTARVVLARSGGAEGGLSREGLHGLRRQGEAPFPRRIEALPGQGVGASGRGHRPGADPGRGSPPITPTWREAFTEIAPGRAQVTRFRQKPLTLFLEGFVHALRIARPEEVAALV